MVTLPTTLLEQLDACLPNRRRSRFITAAIEAQLSLLAQREAVAESAGIWGDTDYPEFADDTAIDNWLTELRAYPLSDESPFSRLNNPCSNQIRGDYLSETPNSH